MKKAIQFGAGNIGRGFIGALLAKSSRYEVLFCDVNDEVIRKINESKKYKVLIHDINSREELIENVSGINFSDEKLILEISNCDVITTAVGVSILPRIANTISLGIKSRVQNNFNSPLNIIACENAVNATEILKNEVFKYLNGEEKAFCELNVGFVNCSVDRIVPPIKNDSIDVVVEDFFEWNVQKDQICGELNIFGMNLVDDLVSYVERKLFTLNTGHSMTAYLGHLKGYKTIFESINDKFIFENVKECMIESGNGLIRKYSFNKEEHLNYINKIIERFKNPYLEDDVLRVGREPMRKLSLNDRFVKPILTCYEFEEKIDKLCFGASCALKFFSPNDENSILMKKIIEEKGVVQALKEISGITEIEILNKIIDNYNLSI